MKCFPVIATLASLALATPLSATVVTFDDLPGLSGVVQNGYGGINWNNNFSYFSTEQRPFTAASGSTRIFANYARHPAYSFGTLSLTFDTPVLFEGFFASGLNWNPVSFGLYVNGVRVAFSDNEVMPTFDPQWLFSTYNRPIDEVRIYNVNGFAAFDNITYHGLPTASTMSALSLNSVAAIPEPSSWAMMIAGFGLMGGLLRRSRRHARTSFA